MKNIFKRYFKLHQKFKVYASKLNNIYVTPLQKKKMANFTEKQKIKLKYIDTFTT